jgi:regulator of RNase E activity RraA
MYSQLLWNDDKELFKLIKEELYTPVVGDLLDQKEYYHQILSPEIKPLDTSMKLIGRSMPALFNDVYEPQKKPFGKLTEALDQINKGEIFITGGGCMRSAYWGEILTATAKMKGGRGAVIDGYHRDTPKVIEQNWPVFSRGGYPQDSRVRTKVVDYRCSIEIGNVRINPEDLVFGDMDGVVIIPKELEEEVIMMALDKSRGEKKVRKEIEQGMSSTEAFEKYGIL